jgi:hypothetical protein
MIKLTRDMQGITYKIQRINTGALWAIFQGLKAYGKARMEDRNVLLINLN